MSAVARVTALTVFGLALVGLLPVLALDLFPRAVPAEAASAVSDRRNAATVPPFGPTVASSDGAPGTAQPSVSTSVTRRPGQVPGPIVVTEYVVVIPTDAVSVAPVATVTAPSISWAVHGGDTALGPAVPDRIRRWESLIVPASRRHGLDPYLVAALMDTESGGDPLAVSPAGARGLMQILDGTLDPSVSVERGAAILAEHLRTYGRLDLALAAYNAGPGAVSRYGGVPPYEETMQHASRTIATYRAFRGD